MMGSRVGQFSVTKNPMPNLGWLETTTNLKIGKIGIEIGTSKKKTRWGLLLNNINPVSR